MAAQVPINGKEKKLALGTYPAVGLAEARRRRDEAKAELALDKDPGREKQRRRVQVNEEPGNTFALIAAEYVDRRKTDGHKPWAARTAAKNEWLLSQLNPTMGRLPIAEIEPLDVLTTVRKIEARGNLESAHRALQFAMAGRPPMQIPMGRLRQRPIGFGPAESCPPEEGQSGFGLAAFLVDLANSGQ